MVLGRIRHRRLLYYCLPSLATVRSMSLPTQSYAYEPPSWATASFSNHPKHGRLRLANLPTPLYQLPLSPSSVFLSKIQSLNTTMYIKRDDASGGVELGGNKVRKLEFLMAEALAQGCDSVLTIGGQQSNHCRATAAAARMLGLEPHLILRTTKKNHSDAPNEDIGLVGNLLMDRMVGSSIYTCTAGEYGRLGSKQLLERVASH